MVLFAINDYKRLTIMSQTIPTTANQPDHKRLKKYYGTGCFADIQLPDPPPELPLDVVLPDDPENPTLSTLKGMVGQYISNTKHEYYGCGCLHVMLGIADALSKNPQLANAALVKTVTNSALHGWQDQMGRREAVDVLGQIVTQSPNLANATLVKDLTSVAANDPDSDVRLSAEKALATVAEKRPDLISPDMVKVIAHTAALPVVNYGKQNDTWVLKDGNRTGVGTAELANVPGKLQGDRRDSIDNQARTTAQQTLKIIADKRPDLMPRKSFLPHI